MTIAPDQKVASVRRVFDTYNARDIDALAALHHEELELVPGPQYKRPGSVFRGRDGLRTCMADALSRYPTAKISAGSIRNVGGWTLARMSWGESPGVAACDAIWLYALEDGLVIRAHGFASEAEALAAARRSPSGVRGTLGAVVDGSRAAGRPALTPRETEIFGLLARGLNAREIAGRLYLSPATVRTHVQNGTARLGARTRIHAIAIAITRGEISL